MTTITAASVIVTPLEVLGYASTREAGNQVHQVLNRSSPDVTLRAAGLRTGTLSFLVATLADALVLEAMHALPGFVRLDDSDLPQIGMFYVATGAITVELEDESRDLWIVSVDYQEVAQ